jgi:hypothetical protein
MIGIAVVASSAENLLAVAEENIVFHLVHGEDGLVDAHVADSTEAAATTIDTEEVASCVGVVGCVGREGCIDRKLCVGGASDRSAWSIIKKGTLLRTVDTLDLLDTL